VKAFRTKSNETLCTLTGLTPTVIKVEEAVKLYIMRKSEVHKIDHEVQPKDWLHPANSRTLKVHRQQNHSPIPYNSKNHNYLIEEIMKKATALEKCTWKIIFTSTKAHTENYGNELAMPL
jgi:hypothetical protein